MLMLLLSNVVSFFNAGIDYNCYCLLWLTAPQVMILLIYGHY